MPDITLIPAHNAWFNSRPLVALAPMEAITDAAYRRIVRSLSRDTVIYTEFVPARGLLHDAEKVWQMAHFDEVERPVVIQLYDNDAESLGKAASAIVKHHRPDGLDLNMGCPVKKVANRGAGCGMMSDPENAAQGVRNMIEHADGVPVSIKTRLGIRDKSEVVEVVQACLEAGAQQVTIHGRLKVDRPRIPADWESISKAALQLGGVPVMGNGDIWTEEDARKMVTFPGIDGVMVARGAIGNPWLLERCCQALKGEKVSPLPDRQERARIGIAHLRANVEIKGEIRGVLELRKVVRNYIKGFRDSKKFWMRIIESTTELETSKILEEFGNTDHSGEC